MLSPRPPPSPAPPACPLTPLLAAQGQVWQAHSLGRPRRRWCPTALRRWTPSAAGRAGPPPFVTSCWCRRWGAGWRLLAPALRAWWAAQAMPSQASRPPGRRAALGRAGAAHAACSSARPTHPHHRACRAWGWIQAGRHQALVWVATATAGAGAVDGGQRPSGYARGRYLAWLPEHGPSQLLAAAGVHAQSSDAPALSHGAARARRLAALGRATAPGRCSSRVERQAEGWALDDAHHAQTARPCARGAG